MIECVHRYIFSNLQNLVFILFKKYAHDNVTSAIPVHVAFLFKCFQHIQITISGMRSNQ